MIEIKTLNCFYLIKIHIYAFSTNALWFSSFAHRTANPEKLILEQADYPADRNLTEEEYIGPEISHDISVIAEEKHSIPLWK